MADPQRPHDCTTDIPGDCWGWRLVRHSDAETCGVTVVVTAQVRLEGAAPVARQALETKGRLIAEAVAFEAAPPRRIVVDFNGHTHRAEA